MARSKSVVAAGLLASALLLGSIAGVGAAPSPENTPSNPKACVGISSTTANAAFQDADPDKFRSEQARGLPVLGSPGGERGRADDVNAIPQCDGIR